MNLNNFEDHIDSIILARGFGYYTAGYVLSLVETGEHAYRAKVEGTELYKVVVEFDKQAEINFTVCDCPYVYGEYCKHQAAVLYALRAGQAEQKQAGTKGKRASKADEYATLLEAQSKEELVKLLLAIGAEYEELKQEIMLQLGGGSEEDLISEAVVLIRSWIDKHSDRDGFVRYDAVWDAVRGADKVLDKANLLGESGRLAEAVKLILLVMREMVDLLDRADDSAGSIGSVIDDALNLLAALLNDEELDEDEQEAVFELLLTAADEQIYDGWSDWRLSLLSLCAEVAEGEGLRVQLEEYLAALIDEEKKSVWRDKYLAERVNLIRYGMVKRFDGEEQAEHFLMQNLHLSDFREIAIEQSVKEKNYERIIELALEGEQQDEHLRGLLRKWREDRYQAYRDAGDLAQQRELALEFIVDGDYAYYEEMKKTYILEEWQAVYPQIISMLEEQGKAVRGVYTSILVEEKEKAKLLAYVQRQPAMVEEFYHELLADYPEELYRLFVQHIEKLAASSGDRGGYKRVCAAIRRLKKIGGINEAALVKERLQRIYKNRPAMQDELSRV